MNPFFAEHLLEFAPDALLLIDTEGRIHYANRAAQAIFGYQPENLTGLKVEHLIPHRLRGSHYSVRSAFTLHPTNRGMRPRTGRLRALRRDGSETDVEINLSPVELEGELHTVVVVREITPPPEESVDTATATAADVSSVAPQGMPTNTSDLLTALQSVTAQLRHGNTDPEIQSLVARQEALLSALREQLRARESHHGTEIHGNTPTLAQKSLS